MADSNEISILFIDGKAIAHSPDRSELIEKAYEIVGDIDDGYPYYSLQTCSLDDFMKLLASFSGRFYNMRSMKNQKKVLQLAEHELEKKEEETDK